MSRALPTDRRTLLVALVGLSALVGCGPSATTTTATTPSAPPSAAGSAPVVAPTTAPPTAGSALDALAALTVKGRGPKTGYTREQFGPAWADVDRNGCDTRNDVLRRDLRDVTFRAGTHDCVVLSGTLAEPYTGATVTFSKSDAGAVQIDHVVALSDAWQKGAAQWPAARRLQLANDPLNLLAVDGPTNLRKGDGDAATWLPPDKGFRCRYVARQGAVKRAYALAVTAAERDAVQRVLAGCPGESLPGSVPAPAPTAPAPAGPAPAGDPDYGTCSNAEAHGAGPYRRGQVEYGYYRDADGDGVVCER